MKLSYDQPLKLHRSKIKYLKDLCQSGLITEQYHQFYFLLFENGTNSCDILMANEENELKD